MNLKQFINEAVIQHLNENKIERIRNAGIGLNNKIEGGFLNKKQAEELQKEIELNYSTIPKFGQDCNDIRKNLYNYDNPYWEKDMNGVNLRVIEGLIEGALYSGNRRRTWLLYADSEIVGKFYKLDDIKMAIKHIEETAREHLNENKTYDELLALKSWYKEEREKLNSIKDFKTWEIKTNILFKQYSKKYDEITRRENAFGMEGDMNANYIYHYTNGDSLIHIIRDNVLLGGGEYSSISFTSNPNLYKRGFVFWYPNEYSEGKHHGNIGVKIKFDFNQMKNDGLKFRKGSEHIGTYPGEDEIRLKQDELENVLKYIKEIIIFKDKERKYLELSNLLTNNNIKHRIV